MSADPPRLGRPMTLEAASRTPDGAGGATLAWVPLGTLWAEAIPVVPGAPGKGARVRGWRVVVRSAPDGSPRRPEPGQRLRDGTLRLVIEAVAALDPEGRFLRLTAREEGSP